jgi:secreted trypsin-like serine protease
MSRRCNSTCDLINTDYVLGGEFMMLSSNPSKDKGATSCVDSGGPVFIHGTNTIVGITSLGADYWCKASWYSFRVDTAPVLSWVNSFLV